MRMIITMFLSMDLIVSNLFVLGIDMVSDDEIEHFSIFQILCVVMNKIPNSSLFKKISIMPALSSQQSKLLSYHLPLSFFRELYRKEGRLSWRNDNNS